MLESDAEPGPERALVPLNFPSVSIYFTRTDATGPLYGLVLKRYLVGLVRARHGILEVVQHNVEVGGGVISCVGGLSGSEPKVPEISLHSARNSTLQSV